MARFWLDFEFNRVVQELQNRRHYRLRNRFLRDNSNPFLIPDSKFKKLFRFPKVLVQQFIEEIAPFIEAPKRTTAIPIHIKLLVTLNFLAHGGFQTTVGEDLNLALSQPSVSRIIREVTTIVGNQVLGRYVKFPVEEQHINEVKQGFDEKFNFPNVIGAIDCTHVALIAPIDNQHNPTITYWCRKGFYSINVQAICDSDLRILAINARYPGATHDSAIWTMSTIQNYLRRKFEAGIRNMRLLGDTGYPLQPWLITPINDAPEDTPEGRFTSRHCTSRNTIERCFGVLKQRFRCILKHRTLHYDHKVAANIIFTCAVLHNICVQNNIELEDEIEDDDYDNDNADQDVNINNDERNWFAEGQRIRNRLVRLFQTEL